MQCIPVLSTSSVAPASHQSSARIMVSCIINCAVLQLWCLALISCTMLKSRKNFKSSDASVEQHVECLQAHASIPVKKYWKCLFWTAYQFDLYCSAPMARPKSGRAPTRAKEQFPSARGMVPKYWRHNLLCQVSDFTMGWIRSCCTVSLKYV